MNSKNGMKWLVRTALASLCLTLILVLFVGNLSANNKIGSAQSAKGALGAFENAHRGGKPVLHERANDWPFAKGPRYGEVTGPAVLNRDVLELQSGSFSYKQHPEGLDIPGELRRPTSFTRGILAGNEYLLVALKDSAFVGAHLDEVKADLTKNGAGIIGFIPNSAYLMKIPAADYNRIRNHGEVAWLGTFEPAYKIVPTLGRLPHPNLDYVRGDKYDLVVAIHDGEDLGALVAQLRGWGGVISEVGDSPGFSSVRVTIAKSRLGDIAQLDAVSLIDEYVPKTPMNDDSQQVHQVGTMIAAAGTGGVPYWQAGVDGSGLVYAVMDDGADMDSGAFAHSTAVTITSALISGNTHRKVRRYTDKHSTNGDGCDGNADCGGALQSGTVSGFVHGQVTSSCGGGYSSAIDGVNTNPARWDGMARGAKLYFSDANSGADQFIYPPASYSTAFFPDIAAVGGVASNHSYGGDCASCTQYTYSSDMVSVDTYNWATNFAMLSFWASGNSGPTDGINALNSCKNCVVVGGNNAYANQAQMYASSSYGLDQYMATPRRTSPWVVATSVGNTTTYSSDADLNTPVEFTTQSGGSGTSYGSPLAEGSAVLIYDYFRKGAYPSGTVGSNSAKYVTGMLVRAALVASADYMTSKPMTIGGGNRFTRIEGYGRVNLSNVLPISTYSTTSTPTGIFSFDKGWNAATGAPVASSGLTNGSTDTHQVTVTDTSRPLRVALSWFDSPSNVNLVNNLDLEVQAPNATLYRGNVFAGANSTTGGSADTLNSTEAVFLTAAQVASGGAGTWTIRVIGTAVPSANPLTVTGSPYGLVAAGGITIGSSVQLDSTQYTCSDTAFATVTETTGGTTATDVRNRTTFVVKNGGGTTVDTETNVTFTQRSGVLVFDSNNLTVAENASPTNNNGILEVQDGYSIQVTYNDTDSPDPVATATVECQAAISDGGGFLDGGCDGDQNIDAGETVAVTLGIFNESFTDYNDVQVTVSTANSNLTILNPTFDVGLLPAQEVTAVVISVQASNTTPDKTSADFVVSVTSPGEGYTVATTFSQTYYLEVDDRYKHYDYIYDFDSGTAGTGSSTINSDTFYIYNGGLFGTNSGYNGWSYYNACSDNGYRETQNAGFTGPGVDGHLSSATFTTNNGVWHANGGKGATCKSNTYAPLSGYVVPTIYTATGVNMLNASTYTDPEDSQSVSPWRSEIRTWAWYHRLQSASETGSPYGWGTSIFSTDTTTETLDPNNWGWWIGGYLGGTAYAPTFGSGGAGAADTTRDNYFDIDLTGLEDFGATTVSWGGSFSYVVGSGATTYGWGVDDAFVYWVRAFRASDTTDTSGDACNSPGTVSWDAYTYFVCNDEVARVSVVDANAGAGPLSVTVSSNAEPGGETVVLDRVGTSALYQGTILLTTSANQAGKLTVGPAEAFTLDATYVDASPSATIHGYANTSCSAGDLEYSRHTINTAGSPANHDGDQFADTSEVINLDIRLINNALTDYTNVTVVASTSDPDVDCIVDNTSAYGTVTAGTTKWNNAADYVTLRMKNSLACTDPNNPGTLRLDLAIYADGIQTGATGQALFIVKDVNQTGTVSVTVSEGFESGSLPSGWTFSALGDNDPVNTTTCEYGPNTWNISNMAIAGKTGTYVARLGTYAGAFPVPANSANYADTENSAMITKAYELNAASVWSFRQYVEMEPGYDSALPEYRLSTDGGDSYSAWTKVAMTSAWDSNPTVTFCQPLNNTGAVAYWETIGTWAGGIATNEATAALGAAGNYIQFRWHAGTDSGYNWFDGWFIDSVSISNVRQPVYVCDTATRTTTACANGTVSNFVWDDTDQDGIQDGGESGISGVTVTLYNLSDVSVASTSTNGSGIYSLSAPAGSYYLIFTKGSRTISPKDQGDDDTLDSDASPTTGRTINFTLASGVTNSTFDCGMYGGGGSAPGEVPQTGAGWVTYSGDKQTLDWGDVATATGYRLYRGGLAELPAVLTSSQDGCLKYDGASSTTTDTQTPTSGNFWWYVASAYNGSGEGTWGNATAGARVINSSGACP